MVYNHLLSPYAVKYDDELLMCIMTTYIYIEISCIIHKPVYK